MPPAFDATGTISDTRMHPFGRPRRLLAAGMLLLASVVRLSAQACAPGELRVFVLDSQGGPVFEAEVHLTSGPVSMPPRGTATEGFADFTRVPCGTWAVNASKEGFETIQASLRIANSGNQEISLVLTPQRQSAQVEVTETAPPVEQSV